jgi:tetratricopeptide (TPR) repeat protein/transcriptional regulator with XRE-family HTH domain
VEPDRLARELTEKLEAARMTAEALSHDADLARDTVGRWIRGNTVPTLDSLQRVEHKLSARLGHPVDLSAAVGERRASRRRVRQAADGAQRRHESRGNQISDGVFFTYAIQGKQVSVQLPPLVTPALSGFPAAAVGFAGRSSELNTVLGVLAPRPVKDESTEGPQAPPSSVVVTALEGLAGIGKTELAIQAGRTALANGWFPGGALFVDMFGYDEARKVESAQALEGFLRALGIPAENIPAGMQERARLYASVLAAHASQGSRVLVVIDNVSAHDQVAPLLPTDGTTAVIVTSRHTLAMLDALLLDLRALTENDGVDLLKRALHVSRPGDTRIRDHPGDAARITRLCDGLPLALRIIAALLAANPARPLAATAADLSDASSRLDELQFDHKAVRTAFELSYQHLEETQARMFRLLSVNPGPDLSSWASAVLAGTGDTEARRILESLARAHLIEPASVYGRWRMHDLVRLYAQRLGREKAESDGQVQARDRLLQHYLQAASASNQHLLAPLGAPGRDESTGRESALEWLDAERPNLIAATIMAAASGHDRVAQELPFRLGVYLDWRRRFADWLTATTVSAEASRRLGDRHREADALNNQGIALRNLRRFGEAVVAHQDAASIYRETGDSHLEGRALNNLGIALQELHRIEEAIAAHQEAVASHRKTGDREGEGKALNNLGLALRKAGRFQESIATCQEAVTVHRETGDKHSEGGALSSLGLALQEIQRFSEAVAAHKEDLAICQKTGDRHGEGVAYSHLGQALRGADRLDEALAAYDAAASIYRETDDEGGESEALSIVEVIRKAQTIEDN